MEPIADKTPSKAHNTLEITRDLNAIPELQDFIIKKEAVDDLWFAGKSPQEIIKVHKLLKEIAKTPEAKEIIANTDSVSATTSNYLAFLFSLVAQNISLEKFLSSANPKVVALEVLNTQPTASTPLIQRNVSILSSIEDGFKAVWRSIKKIGAAFASCIRPQNSLRDEFKEIKKRTIYHYNGNTRDLINLLPMDQKYYDQYQSDIKDLREIQEAAYRNKDTKLANEAQQLMVALQKQVGLANSIQIINQPENFLLQVNELTIRGDVTDNKVISKLNEYKNGLQLIINYYKNWDQWIFLRATILNAKIDILYNIETLFLKYRETDQTIIEDLDPVQLIVKKYQPLAFYGKFTLNQLQDTAKIDELHKNQRIIENFITKYKNTKDPQLLTTVNFLTEINSDMKGQLTLVALRRIEAGLV